MYNIPAAERGKRKKKKQQIQSRKRHDGGAEIQQAGLGETNKQAKTWAFRRVHLVGRISQYPILIPSSEEESKQVSGARRECSVVGAAGRKKLGRC